MSVILMYHALYRGDDMATIDSEDRPYAVSEEQFIAQLDRIAARHSGTFVDGAAPDVIITFDDGHRSNLDIAAPLLLERNLSAYFFVTSGFISNRPGFLTCTELEELASLPGMLVGSHGVTHQFFADMTTAQATTELADSRARVEEITQKVCVSMSFPGGRYTNQTLELLKPAGYVQWFGSNTGTIDATQCFTQESAELSEATGGLSSMVSTLPLNRVAVRQNTMLSEFDLMIASDVTYYRSLRRRSNAKRLLQRTLGNRLYHGLYKSLSSR